jgi:hypothetical protein
MNTKPQEILKTLDNLLGDAREELNDLPGADDKLIQAQVKTIYNHVHAAHRTIAELQLLTNKTKGKGWHGV